MEGVFCKGRRPTDCPLGFMMRYKAGGWFLGETTVDLELVKELSWGWGWSSGSGGSLK